MTQVTIDDLLRFAVEQNASDLLVTVGAAPVVRVNGVLTKVPGTGQLGPDDAAALVTGTFTRDELGRQFAAVGEVDYSYSLEGVARFRMNAFHQRGSVGLVARVIAARVPTMMDLGLPGALVDLARREKGLVLVTGPTGSGKSTTLAAMIDLINGERAAHIVTLEDPIEYLHQHKRSIVNQREVGQDTQSFAAGLRAALREAPDVILVGEMRDPETIGIALTAAETGHLVLATLHTQDAAQTVDRVIDVFPPAQQEQVRVQLAGSIQGIVAQLLLPRADRPGRVAAFEILMANPAVRNLIREGKSHQLPSAIQTGTKYGMRTMEASLRELHAQGLISHEEFQVRLQAATGTYAAMLREP